MVLIQAPTRTITVDFQTRKVSNPKFTFLSTEIGVYQVLCSWNTTTVVM